MAAHKDDRAEFEALVAKLHAGPPPHPRDDQFEHCKQVAQLLEEALLLQGIHWPENRDMILAALGHDLYEDVDPPPVKCVSKYGPAVHDLIAAVTEDDELGVPEYIERVITGPEEAVLIKLCDGISNYGGAVEKNKLEDDTEGTLRRAIEEKMEPMFTQLEGYRFSMYQIAGSHLAKVLQEKRAAFKQYAEDH